MIYFFVISFPNFHFSYVYQGIAVVNFFISALRRYTQITTIWNVKQVLYDQVRYTNTEIEIYWELKRTSDVMHVYVSGENNLAYFFLYAMMIHMNVYLNKAKNQLKGAWVLMPVQLPLFFCPYSLTEKMNNHALSECFRSNLFTSLFFFRGGFK